MSEFGKPAKLCPRIVKNAQIQKSLINSNSFTEPVKKISLFGEIFPAKKSLSDVEDGGSAWHNENTFYKAIGPVLVAGQCFGLLPVCGVLGSDYTNLKFSWRAWRVIYTFIVMGLTAILLGFCIGRILVDGVDVFRTISLMFFISAFTSLILFLRMAANWPKMCEIIAKEEFRKNPLYYQMSNTRRNKHSLRLKFSICTFAVLFFALVEHILSIVAGIAAAYDCPEGRTVVHNFFINSFSYVFYFIKFSASEAAFFQPIILSATFSWNFVDLFIILISLFLTERFELLGDRLDMVIGKHLPEHFWKAARIEFANLAKLVRLIDDNVNKVVLLSFSNNLYFICLQLFNSLTNSTDEQVSPCGKLKKGQFRVIAHLIYFTFSFGFLFTRSLIVSLKAANINTAALRPAAVLYSVTSETYCVEVRRFLQEVTSEVVALTGYNFFYVTRGLILAIAGTIVTYELVLVQFDASPSPVTANLTINGMNNCNVAGSK